MGNELKNVERLKNITPNKCVDTFTNFSIANGRNSRYKPPSSTTASPNHKTYISLVEWSMFWWNYNSQKFTVSLWQSIRAAAVQISSWFLIYIFIVDSVSQKYFRDDTTRESEDILIIDSLTELKNVGPLYYQCHKHYVSQGWIHGLKSRTSLRLPLKMEGYHILSKYVS